MSAALKVWMEGGTVKKGDELMEFDPYGIDHETGKQLIFVEPISINDFEDNVEKDPNFIYKYDVVVFGTWDANGIYSIKTETAKGIISQYIKKGYGVLVGHDIISDDFYKKKAESLVAIRDLFGIKILQADDYYIDPKTGKKIILRYFHDEGKNISIQKKGLLTDYPYEIGDIGDRLSIPFTHSTDQAASGDVWFTFNDRIYYNEIGDILGFYLTTKNNTAMIQTGHSNCNSTEDERKIIANTIYYLKQRTTDNNLIEHSSRDLASPIINSLNFDLGTKFVKIKSTDLGSNYKYMVEAYFEANDIFIAQSNAVDVHAITGVQKYKYAISNNAKPSFDDLINCVTGPVIPLSDDQIQTGVYVHVAAIDGAENVGEISSLYIQAQNLINTKSMYITLNEENISTISTSNNTRIPRSLNISNSPIPHSLPTKNSTSNDKKSPKSFISENWQVKDKGKSTKKSIMIYSLIAAAVIALVITLITLLIIFSKSHPQAEMVSEFVPENQVQIEHHNPLYNMAQDDPFDDDFNQN
ncbi:DUF5057 domain-containing protein [Histomonas meleagridis]|uniref:DUF5057 domain-containing protein n=1 Tax=Histomonas meleagridis TaxID=135588 RepID=UPI00355ABAC0|nr:DUF5057 domain-containing protein [Histomonas meleagridis]KAH0801097.1 DUF5057 domain-containing protein [Histomonas meleagridis]